MKPLPPWLDPRKKYTDTLWLLYFKDHFMYIKDIDRAAQTFACPKCGKLWKKYWMMTRHELTCTGGRHKNVYPGGVYVPRQSVWAEIADEGIDVETDYIYPYRATFDYECYFDTFDTRTTTTGATCFIAKHVPMSCSIASSVPGYEAPKCFVSEGDPQKLVSQMTDHLRKISAVAFKFLSKKFGRLLRKIAELRDENKYLSFFLAYYGKLRKEVRTFRSVCQDLSHTRNKTHLLFLQFCMP
jgi:hypothetical protein